MALDKNLLQPHFEDIPLGTAAAIEALALEAVALDAVLEAPVEIVALTPSV